MSAIEALTNTESGVTNAASGRVRSASRSGRYDLLLSVVAVVRNGAGRLPDLLREVAGVLDSLVTDYELVVVDNASTDETASVLRRLTEPDGLPNLQVYVLARETDMDTAMWAGVESALGDFVVTFDPHLHDITVLPRMVEEAVRGNDVVFGLNDQPARHGVLHSLGSRVFLGLYRSLTGLDMGRQAPRYRMLSRSVVNYLLRHPSPHVAYRYLPALSGFPRASVAYSSPRRAFVPRDLWQSVESDLRLLVSSTRAPMRLVTTLCLVGALSNAAYSVYVILIALLKADVEPGWTTLSLQQSGMFFLISLVLLVLSEYLMHAASFSREGPAYHVAKEYTSAVLTRRQRLNVTEAEAAGAVAS